MDNVTFPPIDYSARDYVKIGTSYSNARVWDVKILSIKESFNILDTENAGRVIEKGQMTLDRIGTFYGHTITFGRNGNSSSARNEYDNLFNFLAYPWNDGIFIEAIHNQYKIAYVAYTSTGERELAYIDEKNHIINWKNFSCNFIPMFAQVTP
uniref:Uncharacterized protein n=1 Tax=Siphoviridae sp. ctsxw88 TaxID=2825701 RepID=A0A8S5PI46_9CAUD|nr:MAG TPA: hypothetical protein [Siphoviridae sp. ctsxw88]